MNKKFILSTLIVLSSILFSCQKSSDIEQLLNQIDTYSVKLENQTKWSIISTDGNLLVADEFASAPTVAINGIFSVYDSIGISFKHIQQSGAYTQINSLSGLRYAGVPSQGLIPVTRRNSPVEVVDTLGKTLFSLDNIDGHNFSASGPLFSDNMLIVREQGTQKWGAVNTGGHIAVQPRYNSMTIFNCGHALATVTDTQTVILNNKGNEKELPDGWIPMSGNFVYDHAILINQKSGTRCVTDTKGNITEFSSSQVPVAIGKSGIICIDNKGQYILHGFSGKQTLLSDWNVAAPVSASPLLIGCKNDKWFISDSKLNVLYEAPNSCSITPLLGNKAYFINNPGKQAFLISSQFHRIDNLPVSRLEQRLYMNDIILSDRENDHREFNSADPGDGLPDWMEPDTVAAD